MDETRATELDRYGRTYLHTLVTKYMSLDEFEKSEKHKKFVDVLSVLGSRGLDVNNFDNHKQTVLHMVVSKGNYPDIIKALLGKLIYQIIIIYCMNKSKCIIF